jgi:hypothetical protein
MVFASLPHRLYCVSGQNLSGFGTSPGYVYVPVGFSVIYIQNAKFGSGGMGGFVTPNGGNGGPGNRATF